LPLARELNLVLMIWGMKRNGKNIPSIPQGAMISYTLLAVVFLFKFFTL